MSLMSLQSWLKSFRTALAPGERHRERRASHRAATHRLNVEALEDRLTPSFMFGGGYPIEDFNQLAPPDLMITSVGSVLHADFNGDGQLDGVTITFPGMGDLAMANVVLSGAVDPPESFFVGEDAIWMGSGDFNGDGRQDLMVDNYYSGYGEAVLVYLNDGNWGSPPPPPPPPGTPTLSIGHMTVTEGNTGAVSANFSVSLSAASIETITVAYATGDGTATAGSDYQADSGTLTFAPAETSKTITVLVNGDRLGEPTERFVVILSDPTNAVITDAVGQCTILDDEPTVSVTDAAVIEGNTGTRSATFTVTLSSVTDVDVTVHYDTADIWDALAGSDYTTASGDVVIPAGQSSATFTVVVKDDRLVEANESFAVDLSAPTNATIADGRGIGTILDDEPRISISDATRREGRKNTTSFVFTVTLSAAYDQQVTMSYSTVNGTATTSDGDYIAKTGTLTFAPGEKTKTITIEVKGDSKKEANETFYLDLFGNSSNSLLNKYRGIGTILNDD